MPKSFQFKDIILFIFFFSIQANWEFFIQMQIGNTALYAVPGGWLTPCNRFVLGFDCKSS